MADPDLRITGADQLYELNRKLKAVDKKLATKLRKAIRQGVKPAVAATKTAILTLPVEGSRGGGSKQRSKHAFRQSFGRVLDKAGDDELGSEALVAKENRARERAKRGSGLRRSIAAAIKVDIKTGSKTAAVRIMVDASKLPVDQRSLPAHLDDPKGWRHPTFGHKPWVAQHGRPWFEVTIRRHVGTVRTSILAAMDDLAREVDT